jgi:hypothetical protein
MVIRVSGRKDLPARAAIYVEPDYTTTIIQGRGPAAALYESSQDLVGVGKVPCSVEFQVLFYTRPWSLSIDAEGGAVPFSLRTDSERQGLPSQTLISPDLLLMTIQFEGE